MIASDNMRIAFISAVYPPTRGGMCTVAQAEAEALVAAGNDVTVFTLHTGSRRADAAIDRSVPEGLHIQRLWGFPRVSLGGFVPQLFCQLRGFDAVYAHLPAYGFMELLVLWKLLFGKKLLVTVHMDPLGAGVFKFLFVVERFIYQRLIATADVVRVSTERLASSDLLKKISREKIQVIPFGIDLVKFSPPAYRTTDKQIFIFVGRLSRTHYFKGVELLLRAFNTLHTQKPDCSAELWIVGDGEQRAHYEHLVEKMKMAKYIKFLGAVSDEELPDLYRRATTIVLPSTDTSETFGLVLLEAMASGVSVIASRLPGVDALVPDGIAGVLIEPGNEAELTVALESVITDRTQWEARGHAARARAVEFGDWTSIAQQIVSLL